MKVIVSGSRYIKDYAVVDEAIAASGFTPTLIIEGGQRTVEDDEIVGGVDWLAQIWAVRNEIKYRTINARWRQFGLAAGPIRNRVMAAEGDALVAIPTDGSKGTIDMIKAMKEEGKPYYIHSHRLGGKS